jgi:uncharacterized protein
MQAYLSFFDKLDKKLSDTPSKTKLLLGLDICKRLYPDYVGFSVKHNCGNAAFLQEMSEYCESQIHGKALGLKEIESRIEALTPLIPDTEDFQSWDVSYAFNAASAVLELLKYIEDGNDKHLSEICSLWIDTVDFKIAEANEHLSDDGIFKHPQMLKTMKEIMDRLENGS